MAIILEDRNVYIKVGKESENNLTYALIKEYENKEARELEKQNGAFKSYLVTAVQDKLKSYYDEMYALATELGFDESVVETYESIMEFCELHPDFAERYQRYHTLYAEEQRLSEFLHAPNQKLPELTIIYEAIAKHQNIFPVASIEDFYTILKVSNPFVVEMRVSIPDDCASSISDVYTYLKTTGIFKNMKDDL
jgi:hypothetical protein